MPTEFTQRVLNIIKSISRGKVMTYGLIAKAAGSPRAARQVVRILHSLSQKEKLPWHRVVNREGKIVLKSKEGDEIQKALLLKEKIKFDLSGKIELEKYQYIPQ